jgi:hypothetical protein
MTVGFGKGSVALTYQALAEALGRDWSTIARAVQLLRKNGDIATEPLRNGSYRWSVILEPNDIVADPEGIYRVRSLSPSCLEQTDSHGRNAMPPMAETPCPHGGNAMPPMAETPWGATVVDAPLEPVNMPVENAGSEVEKKALNIHVKDTCSKIHQQTPIGAVESSSGHDDEPFGHKKLLGELIALGTGQRMARKLLRNHEHVLISRALEKVRLRTDLDNPVGYLIREVEDGGYEATPTSVKPASDVSRETSELLTRPPMTSVGVEQTQAEQAALEAERVAKQKAYQQDVKVLLQRFQGLSEDLKLELKARWTRHLETFLPNTPKKRMLLENRTFQKIAFKEVTTRFFELLDQGLSAERAFAQLAA